MWVQAKNRNQGTEAQFVVRLNGTSDIQDVDHLDRIVQRKQKLNFTTTQKIKILLDFLDGKILSQWKKRIMRFFKNVDHSLRKGGNVAILLQLPLQKSCGRWF